MPRILWPLFFPGHGVVCQSFMNTWLDLYLVEARFALITTPVLTFLFTGRDAAITMNSVETEIMQ